MLVAGCLIYQLFDRLTPKENHCQARVTPHSGSVERQRLENSRLGMFHIPTDYPYRRPAPHRRKVLTVIEAVFTRYSVDGWHPTESCRSFSE